MSVALDMSGGETPDIQALVRARPCRRGAKASKRLESPLPAALAESQYARHGAHGPPLCCRAVAIEHIAPIWPHNRVGQRLNIIWCILCLANI